MIRGINVLNRFWPMHLAAQQATNNP